MPHAAFAEQFENLFRGDERCRAAVDLGDSTFDLLVPGGFHFRVYLLDGREQLLREAPADLMGADARGEIPRGAEPPELEDKMKSVHGMFERARTELQADGVRAGMFLSAIGRMIGLD